MAGIELIEPTDLYNILNQGTTYPCLSDPNYLLLLDARKKHEYNESHILTAKKAPKDEKDEFVLPYDAELECKTNVIVYDGNTSSLKEESSALDCANVMWEMGSRNSVRILKGGYEDFSALYPFLRTQKIIYMPQESDEVQTYPTEVIPGLVYLGNWRQGNAAYIQKDLKIKGHVNCCEEPETFFKEEGQFLMHIAVPDSCESDIQSKFKTACEFIDGHKNKKHVVLVFSQLGISRSSTICLAYLIHHFKWSLQDAWTHIKKCCRDVRPNRGFVEQLSKWEEEVLGERKTDISDPNF